MLMNDLGLTSCVLATSASAALSFSSSSARSASVTGPVAAAAAAGVAVLAASRSSLACASCCCSESLSVRRDAYRRISSFHVKLRGCGKDIPVQPSCPKLERALLRLREPV